MSFFGPEFDSLGSYASQGEDSGPDLHWRFQREPRTELILGKGYRMSFVKFTHAVTALMVGGSLLMVTTEVSAGVECKDIRSAGAVFNALERELTDITEYDFAVGLNSVMRTVTAAVDDLVEEDFHYDEQLNGFSNELVRAYKNEDLEDYKLAVDRLQSRLRLIKNSKCLTR